MADSFVLLNDGSSFVLLNDGSSKVILNDLVVVEKKTGRKKILVFPEAVPLNTKLPMIGFLKQPLEGDDITIQGNLYENLYTRLKYKGIKKLLPTSYTIEGTTKTGIDSGLHVSGQTKKGISRFFTIKGRQDFSNLRAKLLSFLLDDDNG